MEIRMELIILLGLIFVIIVTHTLCGCSKVGLLEGLDSLKSQIKMKQQNANTNTNTSMNPNTSMSPNTSMIPNTSMNTSMNTNTNTSSSKPNVSSLQMTGGKKEGFISGSSLYSDEPSQYKVGDYSQVDTSSWVQPNLEVRPGQPLGEGVKQFLARQEQPVPLPEGEMLMFANTPFKPECCPSTYSNSTGCACMTGKQYNYLIQRGSNNVPYSDF
jgi:hypothetical protein